MRNTLRIFSFFFLLNKLWSHTHTRSLSQPRRTMRKTVSADDVEAVVRDRMGMADVLDFTGKYEGDEEEED